MANIIHIIENLAPHQQQFLLDILVSVQEQKHITQQQAGLVGCTIELFPASEIKRLFGKYPALLRATERLIGLSGMPESGFVNLKAFIGTIIENEIERRVEERSQKTLFDFAGED